MTRIALALAAGTLVLTAHSVYSADAQQSESNKQKVVEFYEKALNQKDFEAASKYLGARYTQHNPLVPDGPEGLKGFIQFLRDKFPNARYEIKRVFADGDYVILHIHGVREPGTRGRAVVDIFKLENGKIVEHWDVIQDVPENTANANGMFWAACGAWRMARGTPHSWT
jgi:predicted SnoaL-like aldol condensation-catalyzing enzyme